MLYLLFRKFSILLLLTWIISSCSPQKNLPYVLQRATTETEYLALVHTDLKVKYILVEPGFSPRLTAALHQLSATEKLQGVSDRKMSQYQKQAQALEDLGEQNFLIGLVHLANKDYYKAQLYLKQAFESGNMVQAGLLYVECQHRLNPTTDLYAGFQEVYDSTTDPVLQKLIKHRYQYYRHGM